MNASWLLRKRFRDETVYPGAEWRDLYLGELLPIAAGVSGLGDG
jgi:hypothetical protein